MIFGSSLQQPAIDGSDTAAVSQGIPSLSNQNNQDISNDHLNVHRESIEQQSQKIERYQIVEESKQDKEYDKEQKDQGQVQKAFIIERYNKQDREQERANKPKLGLRRLTDDKKLVSIELDIPMSCEGQQFVMRQKFDWDLSKEKVSAWEFSKELVEALGLPVEYMSKICDQILGQIMEHVKANTRQKVDEVIEPIQQVGFGATGMKGPMRFNNNDYLEDENGEENDKKRMSRIRRKELQRTTVLNATQPSRYFKEKKTCRHCKGENITPGFECRVCKLPFELLEALDLDDKRVKLAAKYYQKIANKIPLLVYEAKKRHFEPKDLGSFYLTYNKIRHTFESCDQLSKDTLNQVRYIMEKYHEYFLNGQLDFNDQEIIFQKDSKRDPDNESRPKRQRGRPRKVKIISDDLDIPNSNPDSSGTSDSDSSFPDSESDQPLAERTPHSGTEEEDI